MRYGAGIAFGIEDKNIFGSGNSIDSNFNLNSEDVNLIFITVISI